LDGFNRIVATSSSNVSLGTTNCPMTLSFCREYFFDKATHNQFAQDEPEKQRHDRFIKDFIPIISRIVGETSEYITPGDLTFLETVFKDRWFRKFLRVYLLDIDTILGWSILDEWWFNQIFKSEFLDRVFSFVEPNSCFGSHEKVNLW
jgi:hypothetical protein